MFGMNLAICLGLCSAAAHQANETSDHDRSPLHAQSRRKGRPARYHGDCLQTIMSFGDMPFSSKWTNLL